jgi:CO/xanthine dehydrogenase FAD-binding subunit
VQELVPARRDAIAAWQPGDAWLAGGTWLFSEPQPELRRLHDLTALQWPALTETAAGLEIAATCTFAQLAAHPVDAQRPALALLAECSRALLGSEKVWNAATVGGNLCLALAAAPMAALVVALEGRCTVWSSPTRTRTMAAIDLVTGPRRTSLIAGELLRAITLPAAALGDAVAMRQMSLTPIGRSAAVVIARRGATAETTFTVTAAVPRPVTLRFAQPPSPATLRAAIDDAGWVPYDDVHGDPRWRAHLIAMLCEEVRAELDGRT